MGQFSWQSYQLQVPKTIKSINKALGLPKNSKKLWDILSISNMKASITENAGRIDKNEASIMKHHPHSTTTTTITTTTTTRKHTY